MFEDHPEYIAHLADGAWATVTFELNLVQQAAHQILSYMDDRNTSHLRQRACALVGAVLPDDPDFTKAETFIGVGSRKSWQRVLQDADLYRHHAQRMRKGERGQSPSNVAELLAKYELPRARQEAIRYAAYNALDLLGPKAKLTDYMHATNAMLDNAVWGEVTYRWFSYDAGFPSVLAGWYNDIAAEASHLVV